MVDAPSRKARQTALANAVAGVLVFLTPFVVGPDRHAWHHWSDWTAGLLIAATGILTFVASGRRLEGAQATGVLNLGLGGWVFLSGLIVGAFGPGGMRTYVLANVVLGLFVVLVAASSLYVGAAGRRDHPQGP